jgi:hypothetical protein
MIVCLESVSLASVVALPCQGTIFYNPQHHRRYGSFTMTYNQLKRPPHRNERPIRCPMSSNRGADSDVHGGAVL